MKPALTSRARLPGLSTLALLAALVPLAPALADTPFAAVTAFEGTLRTVAAEAGAPILPGAEVAVDGQRFAPGQTVTLQSGHHVIAELTADAEGAISGSFTLPSEAVPGLHSIVVITDSPSTASIIEMKISPDIALAGADLYAIESAQLDPGLYQSAYSARSDALFVVAAVGRPPVSQSSLMRVDPDSLEILASITPAEAPARPDGSTGGVFAVYGVAVDDENGTIWTTNTRQNTVAVYAQDDLSLIHQFEPGAAIHARDVVVDTARDRAYVSAANQTFIEVFDTATLEHVTQIELASDIRGASFTPMSLALDAEAGRLYTVSLNSPEAVVIDTTTNEVAQILPIPGALRASGVAVDPAAGRLFVASQNSDNLLIVDLASGEVLHDVPVGAGALNVLYEPVEGLAWVSNRGAGTVTAVNGEGEIVANIAIGSLPNHIATDGNGRLFAVNKTRGADDETGDHLTRLQRAE